MTKTKLLGGVAALAVLGGLTACQDTEPTPEAVTSTVPAPTTTTEAPPTTPPTTSPPASPVGAEGPAEQAFIATLDKYGVPYSTEDNIIELGYTVCQYLDAGGQIRGVLDALGGSFQPDHAGYIVGAAIGAFCPQHTWQVEG